MIQKYLKSPKREKKKRKDPALLKSYYFTLKNYVRIIRNMKSLNSFNKLPYIKFTDLFSKTIYTKISKIFKIPIQLANCPIFVKNDQNNSM